MAARKKAQPEPAPPKPKPRKKEVEIVEDFEWEGIKIQARYKPEYIGSAHIELHVIEPPLAPIPVTPTGYISHFHKRGEVEAAGGPTAYAKAWLDHESKGHFWQAVLKKRNTPTQLDLFA